ncbi:hypothetical protein NUACC21_56060 [Scytonema sp. NUACC21]
MSWKIKKSSFVGTSHQEQGKGCQDYASYYLVPNDNYVIGAVADGAGSAKHSEIGAKIAVEEAINYLKKILYSKSINNENQAREKFTQVLDHVLLKLKEEAKNKGFLLSDLNSTLLVFIATSNWFAAMQIGDGLIIIKHKNGDYELVFKPDKGEYVNQTTFVTSSDAKERMQLRFQSINLNFICLTTDWCENIFVTKAKESWKPKRDLFEALENCLLEKKNNINYQHYTPESIDELLNSAKINQAIDDDKTLLLCVCEQNETLTPFLLKEVTVAQNIEDQSLTSESTDKPLTSAKINQKTDDKTPLLCVSKQNKTLTPTPPSKEVKGAPVVKQKKRINKRWIENRLKLLYASLAFNVVFLISMAIAAFLINPQNQREIPYELNKVDAHYNNDLWEKWSSQNISVWVLASVKSLDKDKSILKVIDKDNSPRFYKKDIPPKNPLREQPLGLLPPGNYSYFDARNFSQEKEQEQEQEQLRWVRIQVILCN